MLVYVIHNPHALGIDLQAHNASIRAVLRACRSAIIYCSKSQRSERFKSATAMTQRAGVGVLGVYCPKCADVFTTIVNYIWIPELGLGDRERVLRFGRSPRVSNKGHLLAARLRRAAKKIGEFWGVKTPETHRKLHFVT